MKKILTVIALASAMLFSSCYDDSELNKKVNNLDQRLTALEKLCNQMNTEIDALQTLVEAINNNDFVTKVEPVTEDGKEIGYKIYFSKSGTITIYHGEDGADGTNGTDGDDGKDGSTPVIGVQEDNGVYYWTVNGEWLVDSNGNKIAAEGKDGTNGADGADGADGKTPQLEIRDGKWYISYGDGEWKELGPATGANGTDGADGADGDSFFKNVVVGNGLITFTLADGTTFEVPLIDSSKFSGVQSLKFVPTNADNTATLYYATGAADSKVEMRFKVTPIAYAAVIAENFAECAKLQATYTNCAPTDDLVNMPISSCTANTQTGIITIVASGENLNNQFFAGEIGASASLTVSDATSGISSEYIILNTDFGGLDNTMDEDSEGEGLVWD